MQRISCLKASVMFLVWMFSSNFAVCQDWDSELGLEVPQAFLNYHGYSSVEELKAPTNELIKAGVFRLNPWGERQFFTLAGEMNKAINSMLTNDYLRDAIELTNDQRQELEQIQASFKNEIKFLKEENSGQVEFEYSAKLISAEKKYISDVRHLLLPFQLEEISKYGKTNTSIPKLLIESRVGDYLNLTAKQKQRLKAGSDKLASEIERFQNEKRREAWSLVNDLLTPSQFEKLETFIGDKKLIEAYSKSLLNQLYLDHSLDERDAIERISAPTVLND